MEKRSVSCVVYFLPKNIWGHPLAFPLTAIVPLSLFVCYQESKAHMFGYSTASLRRPSVVDK